MTEDDAVRARAYQLIAIGRPAEALQTLASNFKPADSGSWHARAAALLALDKHAEAARAAEEGLAVDPEHPYLYDALATARIGLGDFGGAEEAILAALRLEPEDADLLTRYAHVVASVGQMEKAEKLVLRALSVDPENTFALQMHALLATARNDRHEAMARSRELLRHVPENPLGYRLLGAVHSDEGRLDAARDHLATAVYFDPTDDDVAEAAREARVRSHWLLWPLRPVMRWGTAPVWIAAVATMFLLNALNLEMALSVFLVVWIVYCIYSWVVPPIVRKRGRYVTKRSS